MRDLDDTALERRLREVLDERLGALPLDLTVETLERRRETRRSARRIGRGRGITLLAAALLLAGGALAAGSGLLRRPAVVPPVPDPSLVAVATASPDASPSPASDVPPVTTDCAVQPGDSGEPIGPVAWTPDSMKKDWPAPARPENAGARSVRPMPVQFLDRLGDNESTGFSCVDISWVRADTRAVLLELASKPPRAVEPSEQWIAYGIVTDEDADGVPDWRYGFDNRPAIAGDKGSPWRGWRTNLHTGQTKTGPGQGDPLFLNGGGFQAGLAFDNADYEADARFQFGGALDTTQGMQSWGFTLDMPFYVWASEIVNGRVVATDYAPDSGWLVATPGVPLTPPRYPGGTYEVEEVGVSHGWEDGGSLPLHLSITVPHHWTVGGPWGGGATGLDIGVVGYPWDGCPDTTEPKLGPTFDDLVTYLDDLPLMTISESTDVTVDGYRGRHLRYTAVDGWFDCFSGSPIPLEPGYNEAWIVDVDGVRLVMASHSEAAPSEKVTTEIRQMVESIKIVGVPSSYTPPGPPSPTPVPTPISTPLPPAAGPVPPNARKWTITVDNRSSDPATMWVTDDNGRLVGSATPNVVPAGTTMKVTFLLPADDGWIDANLRPGEGGGLLTPDQVGIPGKMVITPEGDTTWVGPATP
jgi:hypothetical protein